MNKATYTLPIEFIEIFNNLKRDYNVSKSKVVEAAIITGFKLMDEELHDKSSHHQTPVSKKYPNTAPITVNLSDYVFDRLNFYSEKLHIKKSHLVYASLKYYLWTDHYDQKFLDQEIDELMKEVEDCWNGRED